MSSLQFPSLRPFINSEIPLGSNILLIGPPGVGKTVFCENLLCECLKNKKDTLLITLDYAPKDVRKRISMKGIKVSEGEGNLFFVDGYSWLVGESSEQFHVGNLSNLSDLSVKMFTACNKLSKGVFFAFDSISTLLIYNPENEAQRFLEVNMARMKHVNNIGLWIVEQGIHSSSFYNALRHRADGVLEMRFDEQEELMRFIRMHTFKGVAHKMDWMPFVVSKDGKVTIVNENN